MCCPSTCIISRVNGFITVNLRILEVLICIIWRGIELTISRFNSISPRLPSVRSHIVLPLPRYKLLHLDISSLTHVSRIGNDETFSYRSDKRVHCRHILEEVANLTLSHDIVKPVSTTGYLLETILVLNIEGYTSHFLPFPLHFLLNVGNAKWEHCLTSN